MDLDFGSSVLPVKESKSDGGELQSGERYENLRPASPSRSKSFVQGTSGDHHQGEQGGRLRSNENKAENSKASAASPETCKPTIALYESLTANAESNVYTSLRGPQRADRDQRQARDNGHLSQEPNVEGKRRMPKHMHMPRLSSVEKEEARGNHTTASSCSSKTAMGDLQTREASSIVIERRHALFLVLVNGVFLLISIIAAIVSGIAFSKATSTGSSLSKLDQLQDAVYPTPSAELIEKVRFLEEQLLFMKRNAEHQLSQIEEQNRTSDVIDQQGRQTRAEFEKERNEANLWRLLVKQELNATKSQLIQARGELKRQSSETALQRRAFDHRLSTTASKLVDYEKKHKKQISDAMLRRQVVDQKLHTASNKLESQQKQVEETSALLKAVTGSVSSLSSKVNVSLRYGRYYTQSITNFNMPACIPQTKGNYLLCQKLIDVVWPGVC